MTISLRQIADAVEGVLEGEGTLPITRVATLEAATPGDIAFFFDEKKADALASTRATAIVVPTNLKITAGRPAVRVRNPKVAFARTLALFAPARPTAGIHPMALVDPAAILGSGVSLGPNVIISGGARIGANSVIMAGAFIGENVVIGSDCYIYPGARILERCETGDRVIIHSGVVIGSDGFGFVPDPNVNGRPGVRKVPQLARVRIGHDVEIGANTCIDRGPLEDTVIGNGVKIDNLVQIGHNCIIKDYVIIASQVGIAGSCIIGSGTMFAGQAGVADHVHIGEGSRVGASTAVMKSIPAESKVWGTPARPMQEALRNAASGSSLERLRDRVRQLEVEIQKLRNGGVAGAPLE